MEERKVGSSSTPSSLLSYCLQTGTSAFILSSDFNRNISISWVLGLLSSDGNYIIGSPGSLVCQLILQILGLVSLHNLLSQVLIINLFLSVVGDWNMPPQNMSLWHQDYFGLFILKNITHRRSSENRAFVWEIYMDKEISISKGFSSVPEREG